MGVFLQKQTLKMIQEVRNKCGFEICVYRRDSVMYDVGLSQQNRNQGSKRAAREKKMRRDLM